MGQIRCSNVLVQITKSWRLDLLEFDVVALPQLYIRKEPSPFRHLIVVIQLVYLLNTQVAPTRDTVSCVRVSPRSAVDNLVSYGEHDDDEKSDHVLEEVLRAERVASLKPHTYD